MAEVGSLTAKLTLEKGSFSAALGNAKSELAAFGSSAQGTFSKLGDSLGTALKVGAAAGVAALAAVTTAATAGTKAFMEYEKGLQNVGKVSGMADRDLQDFGRSVRDLSMQTGTSVSALNELAASLSSAGVANKDLAPNLKLANSMMVSLGTDATKTGGFIGGLSKAMGFSVDQIKTYASALNIIENSSRATSAYTMDFTEAMIPLGAMFKLDEKALLAFSAVAADAGLQAGETATSINSAVGIAMADPNKMASWAELLETDVDSLKQAMDKDLLAVLKKSAAALGKITSSTEKATAANAIWGRYGMKSIGSLTGALANYDTYYAQVVEDVKNGSQSMGAEEERVYGTLANLYDRAKNTINDFGISVGEVTAGPLKEFLGWFISSGPVISSALQQALSGDFMGAFKTITPVLEDVANNIRSIFGSLSAYLSSVLSGINLGDIAEKVWNALADIGPKIIDGLGGALSAIGSLPWESYWNKAFTAAESAFAKIGDAILSQPWGSWASRAMDLLGQAMQTAVRGAIDLGAWIQSKLSQVNNGAFVSAGRQFAGWVIDGLGILGKLVTDNWSKWISAGIQITGVIVTALGSFAAGIVMEIGSAISSKASSIWDGLFKYTSAVFASAKNLGANIIDQVGMGIASGVNTALKPISDFLNEIIRTSNSLLNTNFSELSLNMGSGNITGSEGNSGKAFGEFLDVVTNPGQFMGGSSKDMLTQGVGGQTLTETLGFKNKGDIAGFLTEMGRLGKTFEQATQAMSQVGFNGNISGAAASAAWASGRGEYNASKYGGMAGNFWTNPTATTTGAAAGGITPSAASNINSAFGSNGILNTLNKGAGGGIVPGNYSVTGAVTDGMKVFVTNWPSGFGAGGAGGSGVNYGVGAGGKFTGNVTPGGPGIGEVATMSANTPYANRLEVDTCQIDEFGMTPGLGKQLMESGVWKPIQGSSTSEQLGNIVGYKGDYSNVGSTAMVGGIKEAYDRANSSQVSTQTKVNTMWNQGVAQANNTALANGQMIGQFQLQSAQFGANLQNQSANTWYNSNVQSVAAQQASSSMFASQTMGAGVSFNANTTQASGMLGSTISAGTGQISAVSGELTASTTGLKDATNALSSALGSQTGGMSTLLGSLNATALGLTSMAQYMGIPAGGAFMSGGGSAGGFSVQSAGGAGSFGSSKASWVGTGATQTGWGAQASNAAKSSSSFYSGSSSGGSNFGSFSFSAHAAGGMVNKPEIAMIGEAGREAVLPNKLVETIMRGTGSDSQMVHMTLNVDGKKLADITGPAIIKRVQQAAGLKVR